MNPKLFRKLREWRDITAKKEGVELFRVLPNKAIEEIATSEPINKEALINIKGIKEKKFQKYGRKILGIVNDRSGQACLSATINKIYSVSEFLDYLNDKLGREEIKLKGEVTSVEERERAVYFNLKDKEDGSVISCLIWRYQYEVSGVKLEIGNEIIVSGYAEIYKPMGKLSLKVSLIELAGEGALKKAYEDLKRKLEKEGLFAPEIKKPIPNLPQTIGLITSNQGAAIGDFTTNLGNYGFKIKFINSSVEGKQAVFDLIKAVKQFKKMKNLDVVVIIRGGGSLESLQAFNNEALVREIANLEVPVICGVGHEKDISLVALVSDLAVSTPTAAARAVRESWDNAAEKLVYNQRVIINSFEKYISGSKYQIEKILFNISGKLSGIFYRFTKAKNNLLQNFEKVYYAINNEKRKIVLLNNQILSEYKKTASATRNKISVFENVIKANNPERQLKLGYSIVLLKGKVVKSVKQVEKGDLINIKMSDGKIESAIKRTICFTNKLNKP
ncbi:MAG: exodeoxyribonuclease VII large subunit [Candidatus Pacebacteria bacterium]|nr:exodeoxyribonuclease VII large subunit [Candidatus Paceibacterota bacterium]